MILLAAGCTFLAPPPKPILFNRMQINQSGDELTLTIGFSGNDVPAQTQADLLLIAGNGQTIYSRSFFIQKSEFNMETRQIQKHLKLQGGLPFAYARLHAPDYGFNATQGKLPPIYSLDAYILPHERQYALHLDLFQAGQRMTPDDTLHLQISDADGTLYSLTRPIHPSDFEDGRLVVLLPYTDIPLSFYSSGYLWFRFGGWEKTIPLTLRRLTEQESYDSQEKDFLLRAQGFNYSLDYAGVRFLPTRTGYYLAHLPERRRLVRFDIQMTDILSGPQLIHKDDFYLVNDAPARYPVYYGQTPSSFQPVLYPNQPTVASFYFNVFDDKSARYSLYYGPKKIAEFTPTK